MKPALKTSEYTYSHTVWTDVVIGWGLRHPLQLWAPTKHTEITSTGNATYLHRSRRDYFPP